MTCRGMAADNSQSNKPLLASLRSLSNELFDGRLSDGLDSSPLARELVHRTIECGLFEAQWPGDETSPVTLQRSLGGSRSNLRSPDTVMGSSFHTTNPQVCCGSGEAEAWQTQTESQWRSQESKAVALDRLLSRSEAAWSLLNLLPDNLPPQLNEADWACNVLTQLSTDASLEMRRPGTAEKRQQLSILCVISQAFAAGFEAASKEKEQERCAAVTAHSEPPVPSSTSPASKRRPSLERSSGASKKGAAAVRSRPKVPQLDLGKVLVGVEEEDGEDWQTEAGRMPIKQFGKGGHEQSVVPQLNLGLVLPGAAEPEDPEGRSDRTALPLPLNKGIVLSSFQLPKLSNGRGLPLMPPVRSPAAVCSGKVASECPEHKRPHRAAEQRSEVGVLPAVQRPYLPPRTHGQHRHEKRSHETMAKSHASLLGRSQKPSLLSKVPGKKGLAHTRSAPSFELEDAEVHAHIHRHYHIFRPHFNGSAEGPPPT